MVEAVKVRGLGSRCLASTAGERRSAVFMREVRDSQGPWNFTRSSVR